MPPRQQIVQVRSAAGLERAVVAANRRGGHVLIHLAPGTYTLTDTLIVTAPDVTFEGQPDARRRVIVQGVGMSPTARIGNLIRVSGSHFTLSGMMLRRSRWHLIQIAGEDGAEAPVIRDCVLENAYEQLIKVSDNPAHPNATANGGVVEHCLFEYTAGIGPEYYIGGIDAHGAKHWIVRDNVFRNIASPSRAVAEFAVHFWDGSADDLVERNLIVNCDRGIGFGLDGKPNHGGVIRNNMIYHAPRVGPFADTGIALTDSPGTQVYNNTILLQSHYPRAIEYRFPATRDVFIANNLTNRAIASRNGGHATVTHNLTDAAPQWFVNAAAGDLRLGTAIPQVIAAGIPIAALKDDFSGNVRPRKVAPDIGADQWSAP
ncbi:MAG: right-handed parallel beta-helix repeat-containing protein [Steroidobacteraceae bacterium]